MAILSLCYILLSLTSTALGATAPAPGPSTVYQRPQNSDCVTSVNNTLQAQSINYFPRSFHIGGQSLTTGSDKVTVTVARDFSVQYFNNFKVVTNTVVNETYVLYQCGTPPPSGNSLPAGSKLFSVPLTSVAVLETVPVAFLTQLGVMSRVQSVSSFAVNSCGQELLSCGKSTALSTLDANASSLNSLLPYNDAVIVSQNISNALATLAFSSASDPGPLNRAEWIKFLGLFFNLDALATNTFNTINSSYYRTKDSVKPAQKRPVLAFISLFTYPPDTTYEVSLAAYKVNYTEDAGATAPNMTALTAINGTMMSPFSNSTIRFAWNASTGGFASKEEATAAFHKFLQGVDIVIDETAALDPTAYNLSTFLSNMNLTSTSNYTFLTNKTVYREDGLVSPAPIYGLDWFEGALAQPDLVLKDFVHAVNPSQSQDYKPTWIRNIATGENVTITASQNCNQLSSCSAPPSPICPLVSTCSNGTVVSQKNYNSTCSYEACTS